MPNIDSDVVSHVPQALLDDPRLNDAVIDVSSQGGVVTLIGTVPSQEIRQIAEEVASRQEGVISVISDLALQTDEEDTQPMKLVPPR